MAKDTKNDKIERRELIPPAYVHHWTAASGLLYREFTNRDIGIDGMIEYPRKGETTKGFVLIQLKETPKAIDGHTILPGVALEHLSYWQSLPAPIVCCVVRIKDSGVPNPTCTALRAYWINLREAYRRGISDITTGKFSLTFSQLASLHPDVVWETGAPENTATESVKLRGRLENAMSTVFTFGFETALDLAETNIDAARNSEAREVLNAIKREWPTTHIATRTRHTLLLRIAKAQRRIGNLVGLEQALEDINAPAASDADGIPENLIRQTQYEEAWLWLLKALDSTDPVHWDKAVKHFKLSAPPSACPNTSDILRERLIAQSGVLHTLAVWKWYDPKRFCIAAGAVRQESKDLEKLIKRWGNQRESAVTPSLKARFLANAYMSLCRYHLAEGNLEAVEKLLPILEPLLTNSNGYRSFHSVTHLYLLKVRWLYKKSQVKDPNYAVAQLRLLVDASKPNKELESYFSKVADELQPAGR